MKHSLTLASTALIATLTFSSTASAETTGEENQGWGGYLGGIDGDVQQAMSSIRSLFLEAKAEILEQYSNLRGDRAARAELRERVSELRQQAREARGEVRNEARSNARAARASARAANQGNRGGERAAQRRARVNSENGNAVRPGANGQRVRGENGQRVRGDNGQRVRGDNGQRARGANGRRGPQHIQNAGPSANAARNAE